MIPLVWPIWGGIRAAIRVRSPSMSTIFRQARRYSWVYLVPQEVVGARLWYSSAGQLGL